MANRPRNDSDETAELKRLLFEQELEILDRVRERTAVLHHRVGDDDALTESVRRVIVDALRQSDVADHDRIASAVAPLVLPAVRREIEASRETLVETLRPEAGTLFRAGLGAAAGGVLGGVARPIDWLISPSRWAARFGAASSGRSVEETLRRRSGAYGIDHVALIHRPTGLMIAEAGVGDGTAFQADAVQAAREQMGGKGRGAVAVDGAAFAADRHVILAMVGMGAAPEDLADRAETARAAIVNRWSDAIHRFDGALDADDMPRIERDLMRVAEGASGRPVGAPAPKRPTAGFVVLGLLAMALLAWLGYRGYLGLTAAAIEAKAREVAAPMTARGAALSFEFNPATDNLAATGEVADRAAAARLRTGLSSISGVEALDFNVRIASGASAAGADDGELAARIAALEARSGQSAGVDPVSRIALWLAQHPIRFADGARFADPVVAGARLDAVASVIAAWDLNMALVVAGYSDPRDRRAGAAASERANAVRQALIDRGVPARRLIAISRGAEKPVAGAGSPANRRVEFEIAWR